MSAEINYKNKYMEIRGKYMADLDMAFRLGFEQGQQQAEQEQMMQAQQQQAEMEAAAAGQDPNMQGGAPGEEQQPGQEQQMDSSHPGGSELDQHIAELEGMLKKSEDPQIKKTLASLVSFRKNELANIELKKSSQAISGIAKALHKPKFKIGVQASHNLTDNAKKAVTMQNKIVTDIMKSWAEEEKKASNSVKNILGVEGLTKKE